MLELLTSCGYVMQLLASLEHADAATSSSGDSLAVASPVTRLLLLRAIAFNLSYSGNCVLYVSVHKYCIQL
jgi:hypothetical protein